MSYILALDQGTTSSRAIVFDKDSRIISVAQKEFTQIFPNSGWVEHNPQEIWETQRDTAIEALRKANLTAERYCRNRHYESDAKRRLSGIEKRANRFVMRLSGKTAELPLFAMKFGKITRDLIREKTGLEVDAYFSASKINWILENVRSARRASRKRRALLSERLIAGWFGN